MKTLITLHMFSTLRGSKLVDPTHAWSSALDAQLALQEAELDGQVVAPGFVALVFHGGHGVERISRPVISDDGRGIAVQALEPLTNLRDAQAYAAMVTGFAEWCNLVGEAERANRRPPVLDQGMIGEVPQVIRDWIGRRADRYVKSWREARHQRLVSASFVEGQVLPSEAKHEVIDPDPYGISASVFAAIEAHGIAQESKA